MFIFKSAASQLFITCVFIVFSTLSTTANESAATSNGDQTTSNEQIESSEVKTDDTTQQSEQTTEDTTSESPPQSGQSASSSSSGSSVEVSANSDFDSVAKIDVPNDVGSDGAFVFSVPIKIPEFRGLEPNISLSYNSGRRTQRGVDNIVGQGWRLTGFSKIQRVTAGRGLPSFNNSKDVYLLDGQELVACDANADYHPKYIASRESASCTAGGDYTTYRESYLKITRDAGTNSFTVTNKDGTKYIYSSVGVLAGEAASSTSDRENLAFKRVWLLSEIADVQTTSNVVQIEYIMKSVDDGLAHRPLSVLYADQSGGTQNGYKVEFFYSQPANAINPSYATGTSYFGDQNHRLSNIQVFDGSAKIRAYKLEHTFSSQTKASLLSSVTEYGSDFVIASGEITGDSTLPAVTFEYSSGLPESGEPAFELQTYMGRNFTKNFLAWDKDKDGRDDLIFWDHEFAVEYSNMGGTQVAQSSVDGGAYQLLSDRSTVTDLPLGAEFNLESEYPLFGTSHQMAYADKFKAVYPFAKNDWFDVALKVSKSATYHAGGENGIPRTEISAFFEFWNVSNPAAGTSGITNLNLVHGAGGGAVSSSYKGLFNLDSDPQPEALFVEVTSVGQPEDGHSQKFFKVYDVDPQLSGPPTISEIASHPVPPSFADNQNPIPMDLNGDGVTELYFADNNSSSVANWYAFNPISGATNPFVRPYALLNGTPSSSSLQKSAFGDVNGDGAVDVVLFNQNSGTHRDEFYVHFSDGSKFAVGETWKIPFGLGFWGGHDGSGALELSISVKDVNADGLADVVVEGRNKWNENPQGNASPPNLPGHYPSRSTYVFLSTGSGFVQTDKDGNLLSEATARVPSAYNMTGDFDGDGLLDFVGGGEDGTIAFTNATIPFLAKRVETSTGGEIEVEFASTSIVVNNASPQSRQVVTSITGHDGRGNSRTTDYTYEGGRFDFERRRSLGFEKVTTILPAVSDSSLPSGTVRPYIETDYSQDRASAGQILNQKLFSPRSYYSRQNAPSTQATTHFEYSHVENVYQTFGDLDNLPLRSVTSSSTRGTRYDAYFFDKSQEYGWNIYGEPTFVKSFGYGGEYDDLTTQFWYAPNLSKYIVNKPLRKQVRVSNEYQSTWSIQDRTNWLSVEYYHYDNNSWLTPPRTGNISMLNVWDGSSWDGSSSSVSTSTEAQFEYDNYGNQTAEINQLGHRTEHEYDSARALFVVKTTNAVGHEAEMAWNETCQQPSQSIDANDLVTQFTYDTHCREVSKQTASGGVYTTSYNNIGDPKGQYVENTTPTASLATAAKSYSREYFDGFGQTYLVARSGIDETQSEMIAQVSHYDQRGNLEWQSLPLVWADASQAISAPKTYSVSNAQKTRFDYDGLNRPVRTKLADGNQTEVYYNRTNFNYDGWLTTLEPYYSGITDPGGDPLPDVSVWDEHCFDNVAETQCKQTRTAVDSWGNTILSMVMGYQSDINGSMVSFESTHFWYNPKGNLLRVHDPKGNRWFYEYDNYGNRVEASDPGLGRWAMEYDAAHRLKKQTDAKGQTIAFTYDAIDRQLTKTVSEAGGTNPVVTTSTYDDASTVSVGGNNFAVGQLSKVEVSGGHSIAFSYSKLGQTKISEYVVDGDTSRKMHLRNRYFADGTLSSLEAPNAPGGTAAKQYPNFEYDTAGRLTHFGSWINGVDYNLRDQATKVTFGSGSYVTTEYDAERGWTDRIKAWDSAGDNLYGRSYYYRSATGRVNRVWTSRQAGRFRYTYDWSGRLTLADQYVANSEAAGVTIYLDQDFSYDKAGRMLFNSALGAYSYPAAVQVPSNGNSPHVHAPNSVDGQALSYDDNGNMTTGLHGKVMSYDAENRPLSVVYDGTRTEYVYGADGTRLKQMTGAADAAGAFAGLVETTVYMGGIEIRKWGEGAANEEFLYYPHENVRIRTTAAGEEVSYLVRDQLGSVRAIFDEAEDRESNPTYTPFGVQTPNVAAASKTTETKGFIGERYDAGAGLQYLNARYYDPELALFIQPDWFEVIEPEVGANRYSYSFNDPVNKMDPSGNKWLSPAVKFATNSSKKAITKQLSAIKAIGGVKGRIADKAIEAIDAVNAVASPEEALAEFVFDTVTMGALSLGRSGKIASIRDKAMAALAAFKGAKSGALKRAMNTPKGKQAHHVIAIDLLDDDVVQDAIKGGFVFNGVENGISVSKQAGAHQKRTSRIRAQLEEFKERNPNYTKEEALEKVREIADAEKKDITKLGDIVTNE